MLTKGDDVRYINENYTNRLTHSVSDSAISYTLQEMEDKDATGGFYGVEVNGVDTNTDAFIFIYCECFIKSEKLC